MHAVAQSCQLQTVLSAVFHQLYGVIIQFLLSGAVVLHTNSHHIVGFFQFKAVHLLEKLRQRAVSVASDIKIRVLFDETVPDLTQTCRLVFVIVFQNNGSDILFNHFPADGPAAYTLLILVKQDL